LRELRGQAVGWGYLVNRATGNRLPRPEWREEETIHALSGEEVERLLAAAPPECRTLFLTSVSTGVRLGELRALR
jgi:integrase